jgi:hypothetical protein
MSDDANAGGWVSPIYPKERLVIFLSDGRHVEVSEERAWACIRACVGVSTEGLMEIAPGELGKRAGVK